jgi:hypothetical protein
MNGPQDGGYDDALTALRNHVEDLAVALAIWEARQEDAPDPHARRCASDAVGAIDASIGELHAIRARLITEVRASDDATAMRADALLAGMRGSNDSLCPSGPGDTRGQRGNAGPDERNTDA